METVQLCPVLPEIPGKDGGGCLQKFCVQSSCDTMPTISTFTCRMKPFGGTATLNDPKKEEGGQMSP